MREHCIDVYFKYRGKAFHALTYGTIIPHVLNDVDRNRKLQHQVAVEIARHRNPVDTHIEQEYVASVRNDSIQASGNSEGNKQLIPDESMIVQMFKPNAELGFYSYDCIEELENGRGLYRLVAAPGAGIDAQDYEGLPSFEGIDVVEFDEQRRVVVKFIM